MSKIRHDGGRIFGQNVVVKAYCNCPCDELLYHSMRHIETSIYRGPCSIMSGIIQALGGGKLGVMNNEGFIGLFEH